MNKLLSNNLAFLMLCSAFVAGCGTFGATSVVKVQPSKPAVGPMAKINVGSVNLADDATKLDAVMVIPVGKFSASDLNKVTQSLRNAVSSAQSPQDILPGRTLTLHVLLRRYLVTTSNSAAAALGCVAWCALDETGKIVCDEQFYASDSVVLIGTVGAVKNKVNRAIVQRITDISAHLASPQASSGALPAFPENAFGDFAAATKDLPQEFRSVHALNIGGWIGFATSGAKADWTWVQRPDGIKWPEYIKTCVTGTKP